MSDHPRDPEPRGAGLPPPPTARTPDRYRAPRVEMAAAIPKPDTPAMRAAPGPPCAPFGRVLAYVPGDRGDAPTAAILPVHGGGFGGGSAAMSDASSRAPAADPGRVVVPVDCRLAPETRFPGVAEDCHAALSWLHGTAAGLGIAAARIVVAGAGAGLVAAPCLLARDRGGVQPCFRHLAGPMPDHRGAASDHPRVDHIGRGALPGAAGGAVSPCASPALADDLAGLPPAFIHVGAIDAHVSRGVARTALGRALHGPSR